LASHVTGVGPQVSASGGVVSAACVRSPKLAQKAYVCAFFGLAVQPVYAIQCYCMLSYSAEKHYNVPALLLAHKMAKKFMLAVFGQLNMYSAEPAAGMTE